MSEFAIKSLRRKTSADEKIDAFEGYLAEMDRLGTDMIQVPGFLGVTDTHTRRQVLNALQDLAGKRPIAWAQPADEYDRPRGGVVYRNSSRSWCAELQIGDRKWYGSRRRTREAAASDLERLRAHHAVIAPYRTRCPQGHYMTKKNFRVRLCTRYKTPVRECRKCREQDQRNRRARQSGEGR